jgi:hypothetical protein
MGDQYQHLHGYNADDDDACVVEVTQMIIGGGPPKPKQIDMAGGFKRHVGVAFASRHFAVLDFVLTSRIAISCCHWPYFGNQFLVT